LDGAFVDFQDTLTSPFFLIQFAARSYSLLGLTFFVLRPSEGPLHQGLDIMFRVDWTPP
jgi:hypothetical protein